ncbi:MAG: oxidoreductase domain protein [Herbinix sp.]|jgi:predicted dehydrogenase|nr:oxidoreductase domain protein [Herbinix sp.]
MKKFAVIGCGYWSTYQIAGWMEVGGVELVAVYNRTRTNADRIANKFGVTKIYDSAEELFENEELDFVDIITDVDTHEKFTTMAAQYGVPVICQKPMAPNYIAAERMVNVCKEAKVPLMIHDNWRWQYPIREVKKRLEEGCIGKPFRARITYSNSFPVFENQPFLAELEQFILTDMGTHIFDTVRFLFGEAKSIFCQTATIHKNIKGEDVATCALKMESGLHCSVELSYTSTVEQDCFPETFLIIEGDKGSIELAPHGWVRTTTKEGTHSVRVITPYYEWVDRRYYLSQTATIEANRDFLQALLGEKEAETTGEDNLKTLRLVYAAYESAEKEEVIRL